MKRQTFRLGNVLRYYEIQKERSEYELHQASRVLQEIEREIERLGEEISAVAAISAGHTHSLSAAAWIACSRKSEHLGTCLVLMRRRYNEQARIVARLQDQRQRWAVAVEALLTLKHQVASANEVEAAKTQQILLDETVLRQWPSIDS